MCRGRDKVSYCLPSWTSRFLVLPVRRSRLTSSDISLPDDYRVERMHLDSSPLMTIRSGASLRRMPRAASDCAMPETSCWLTAATHIKQAAHERRLFLFHRIAYTDYLFQKACLLFSGKTLPLPVLTFDEHPFDGTAYPRKGDGASAPHRPHPQRLANLDAAAQTCQ